MLRAKSLQSYLTLCNAMYCKSPLHGLFCPWDSPGKNTGEGCHAFLQGILLHPGIRSVSLRSPALTGRVFTAKATSPWFPLNHPVRLLNSPLIPFYLLLACCCMFYNAEFSHQLCCTWILTSQSMGARAGNPQMCLKGILVILNYSYLKKSWCKNYTLTLLSVSLRAGKKSLIWNVPSPYLEGEWHPCHQRYGIWGQEACINRPCYFSLF